MTFASQYRMPGTYFEPQPGGVHPGVFRPPESPSASSSLHLARSSGSYYSEATTPLAQVKRKRRTDPSREVTPLHDWCDGNMNLDSNHETPQPNRHVRYTLAGQLETPGAGAAHPPFENENGTLDESMYSDADYRRQLGSKRPHQEMESPVSSQPTMLVQPIQPVAEGWSRFAFNTIGGVVGKVWEFCKAGAFRGFSAGGGKAYTIDGQVLPDSEPEIEPKPDLKPELQLVQPTEFSEKTNDVAQETTMDDASAVENTPPGGFPQSVFNYAPLEEHGLQGFVTPETTPSRPAVKRRQTSAGNHDELRNWVVVDEPQAAPGIGNGTGTGNGRRSLPRAVPRPASRSSRPSMVPGRRISVPKPRLNATPTAAHRPTSSHSTISHAGTPSLSSREPASFAGFRSPETPVHMTGPSPSRIPVPIQPAGMSPNPFARPSNPATRQSGIPSPAQPTTSPQSHRRSQSSASAASVRPKTKEYGAESIRASPRLDAEAKRLAARRARDEQDSDALIDDFNHRLKEMIRQGREALGTKIEIDGDDGGWMDD
ncbi:hypothetical protein CSOJ01_09303 [Colletotrichum sojae]|uniref:Uncharacterized protein n=1 Tax=Colletotrichum sojae TaxID=2175907 RepID=A0A8H6J397_9PEZI|nr:hypothetical protein CSOJ01_09303 [Colletotrichum sojae]